MDINVLPWRGKKRRQNLLQNFCLSAFLLSVSLSLFVGIYLWQMHQIHSNEKIHRTLGEHIAKYNISEQDIIQMRKQRAKVSSQLFRFERLFYLQRCVIKLLHDLPDWFDNNIYLVELMNIDSTVHFLGYVQSNVRLTQWLQVLNQKRYTKYVSIPKVSVSAGSHRAFELDLLLNHVDC